MRNAGRYESNGDLRGHKGLRVNERRAGILVDLGVERALWAIDAGSILEAIAVGVGGNGAFEADDGKEEELR